MSLSRRRRARGASSTGRSQSSKRRQPIVDRDGEDARNSPATSIAITTFSNSTHHQKHQPSTYSSSSYPSHHLVKTPFLAQWLNRQHSLGRINSSSVHRRSLASHEESNARSSLSNKVVSTRTEELSTS